MTLKLLPTDDEVHALYVCTEQFQDGPYIGDFMVSTETAN